MDSRPLPLPPLSCARQVSEVATARLHRLSPGLPQWRHGQVTASIELSRSWLPASLTRPLLGNSSLGDRERHGGGCDGRCGVESPAALTPYWAGSTGGGVRWNRDAAPAWPCPPAWWVGRSLATRPRAVTPRERPEDPPARGDRHPARHGVRQGPYLYLLAEARRLLSVHPADLRLALPGLPQLRAAVLQPRRPAVSGAGHRGVGGAAGPAVASQGGDEGPPGPRRSGR
jgi:hypothetical protein